MAGIGDLVGGITGGISGGAGSLGADKLGQLAGPLVGLIQSSGGLGSMLGMLQSSPIGGAVSSWIGTGPNEAVSADQIGDVVGEQNVETLAAESGLSTDEVKSGLSELLPGLVDRLTPGGGIPGAEQLQGLLGSLPGGDQIKGLLGAVPGADAVSGMLGGLLGGGKG